MKSGLASAGTRTLTTTEFDHAVDVVLASVPEFDTSNPTLFGFGLATRCRILKRE